MAIHFTPAQALKNGLTSVTSASGSLGVAVSTTAAAMEAGSTGPSQVVAAQGMAAAMLSGADSASVVHRKLLFVT